VHDSPQLQSISIIYEWEVRYGAIRSAGGEACVLLRSCIRIHFFPDCIAARKSESKSETFAHGAVAAVHRKFLLTQSVRQESQRDDAKDIASPRDLLYCCKLPQMGP